MRKIEIFEAKKKVTTEHLRESIKCRSYMRDQLKKKLSFIQS